MKTVACFLLTAALALPLGCATVDLPPATKSGDLMEKDEKNLWVQSGRIAEQIRSGRMLYVDENLSAYLNSVARRLFPEEVTERIPFYINVVNDPRLNAFALPNGEVFLHTGILARMENEAQLATLLAHEMTHSTHRHSVRSLRDLKNKSAFFSIASIGGGDYGSLLGTLGFMASVSGYSRDMEREADAEGFKLMVQAGYDPLESPKLFEHLKEELETSGRKEPFFFGSHPRLQERINSYREFIGSLEPGSEGRTETEAFMSRINRLVLENAELDLTAGRYAMALKGVERYVGRNPKDPSAFCLQGMILQQQGLQNGDQGAVEAFRKALAIDPDLAEAHRGIGLIAYKKGDRPTAAIHLQRYITLEPEAPDRAYIEQYIDEVRNSGGAQ